MKEEIGLSNSSSLTIRGLSYAFHSSHGSIFQDLSFEIKKGEFVSLIGQSGSGKSTLFKLITGLLDPKQGEINIHNSSAGDSRLGKVGYMPQKDMLLPWRTVIDNVLLSLEVTGADKKSRLSEARQWLSRFGLENYENSFPSELSGGMRQRVAFLRTIMTGHDLLLLDEPFGALDSLTKRQMHSWLLGIWEELQKTVLFITHDLEEAILLSDRIFMLKGQGIEEVRINLPRPRKPDFIYDPEFIEMRKQLERQIQHEG